MRLQQFIAGLGISAAIYIIAFLIYIQFVRYDGVLYFGLWVLCFFIGISVFIFATAIRFSQSTDIFKFNRLIIISTVLKIFGSVIFILSLKVYLHLDRPIQIIPFLISYVIFTIFEVHYLSVLSKKPYKK